MLSTTSLSARCGPCSNGILFLLRLLMKLHVLNRPVVWIFASNVLGVLSLLAIILQKIESDNFGVSDNNIRIEVCASLFLKRGDC